MSPENLGEAFETFESDALRLEGLSAYAIDEESAAFASYSAGEEPIMSFLDGWLSHLREATSRGCTHRRVRLLSQPPSRYENFEIDAAYPLNAQAGEQIRLSTHSPSTVELPDAWIFDHKYVFVMDYSESGAFRGSTLMPLDQAPKFIERVEELWPQTRHL